MKELNAAGVIGHFAFGKDLLNGQTIKTKIIAKGLEDAYGTERVKKADTSGGATALMKLPFMLTVLSIAPLIGEAIKRIHGNESVNDIFNHE